MRKLGISVYPDSTNLQEILNYITIASKYNFKRIFTCLISANNSNNFLNDFEKIVTKANQLDMEIIADVSPDVLKQLEINYNNLSKIRKMGLSGIRLDLGFSGMEESIMSFDSADLMIELNMSNGNMYLENILSYMPKKQNIIGCHNFYPHRYTGLSEEHFLKTSKQFKELGIRTAAFVSSNSGRFGPWPVNEGLPTLEAHRNLPIDVQAKDLLNSNLIDDVIIGNAYASEEELKVLGNLNLHKLQLKIEEVDSLKETERKILYEEPHFNRGDISEYMLRSTQSRVKYSDYVFDLINPKKIIEKGDIIIESSEYKRYAGELQIALKSMENSGKSSVVGKVCTEELFLLEKISPWQKFEFIKKA